MRLNEANFKIKELTAREKIVDEEADQAVSRQREAECKLDRLKLEMQQIDKQNEELDDEIRDMKNQVELADLEMFKERENIMGRAMGGTQGKRPNKESIFSNNYAVQVQNGERKTVIRATVQAPQKNGDVKQTKPYCTLI